MPQIRRKGGKKQFIITAAEERRFEDVSDTLDMIAAMRDSDDLLTANAGQLAKDLRAFGDAIAKPLAKRDSSEQAAGGARPLLDDAKMDSTTKPVEKTPEQSAAAAQAEPQKAKKPRQEPQQAAASA